MGKDTAQKQQFWSPEEKKAHEDAQKQLQNLEKDQNDRDDLDGLDEIEDINPQQQNAK